MKESDTTYDRYGPAPSEDIAQYRRQLDAILTGKISELDQALMTMKTAIFRCSSEMGRHGELSRTEFPEKFMQAYQALNREYDRVIEVSQQLQSYTRTLDNPRGLINDTLNDIVGGMKERCDEIDELGNTVSQKAQKFMDDMTKILSGSSIDNFKQYMRTIDRTAYGIEQARRGVRIGGAFASFATAGAASAAVGVGAKAIDKAMEQGVEYRARTYSGDDTESLIPQVEVEKRGTLMSRTMERTSSGADLARKGLDIAEAAGEGVMETITTVGKIAGERVAGRVGEHMGARKTYGTSIKNTARTAAGVATSALEMAGSIAPPTAGVIGLAGSVATEVLPDYVVGGGEQLQVSTVVAFLDTLQTDYVDKLYDIQSLTPSQKLPEPEIDPDREAPSLEQQDNGFRPLDAASQMVASKRAEGATVASEIEQKHTSPIPRIAPPPRGPERKRGGRGGSERS